MSISVSEPAETFRDANGFLDAAGVAVSDGPSFGAGAQQFPERVLSGRDRLASQAELGAQRIHRFGEAVLPVLIVEVARRAPVRPTVTD